MRTIFLTVLMNTVAIMLSQIILFSSSANADFVYEKVEIVSVGNAGSRSVRLKINYKPLWEDALKSFSNPHINTGHFWYIGGRTNGRDTIVDCTICEAYYVNSSTITVVFEFADSKGNYKHTSGADMDSVEFDLPLPNRCVEGRPRTYEHKESRVKKFKLKIKCMGNSDYTPSSSPVLPSIPEEEEAHFLLNELRRYRN